MQPMEYEKAMQVIKSIKPKVNNIDNSVEKKTSKTFIFELLFKSFYFFCGRFIRSR